MAGKEAPIRTNTRRFSLTDQARALAVVLQEEFGVPFSFYEADLDGAARLIWAAEGARPVSVDGLAQVSADGKACVLPGDDGRYHLVLLLHADGKPALLAAGELAGVAPPRSEAAAREQTRLQKWLQAVADRLRLVDQHSQRSRSEEEQNHQASVCWEALFTLNHLLGRLRIHKDAPRNQRRILEAAYSLLHAQTLIWVPKQTDATVLIQGDPCLAPTDCRQMVTLLAPDLRDSEPLLCNDLHSRSWSSRFPQLRNLLAFPITDQGAVGWVIAVNKQASGGRGQKPAASEGAVSVPFRKSDAALLTPFVGLLGLHLRASERYQDLKELLVGLTRSLTAALDAKDSYTYGHSERVARIAVELGREMGLQEDELGDIYLTGLLHDVGKIGVRDAILSKREPLTAEEFEHIKQHVTIGYTILADLRPIRNLLPGVLYHHERIDGTGYPDGLAGDSIPLLARILAVADAYDAMCTTRPYREALPCRRVEEILVQGAGTQWDRQVVEAFLRCRLKVHAIRQRGVGDSLRQAIDGALHKEDSIGGPLSLIASPSHRSL